MENDQKTSLSHSSVNMNEEILANLANTAKLERLFRQNKAQFSDAFNELYPEIKGNPIAEAWHERLNYKADEIDWGKKPELAFIAIAILLAGFIAKIPDIFSLDKELFFSRNIGFIVFPLLAIYFGWSQKLSIKKGVIPALAFLLSVMYVNILPNNFESSSIVLAYIHLPVFLWTVVGYLYIGTEVNQFQRRINFLRFNGDLVVMGSVIALAGILFTAITINLFNLLEIEIEPFFQSYILPWGLPAVPIVAVYLVQNNPQLVSRISPVIARIFAPLVLVMLVIFLVAMLYTEKDPYNDRDFLILFNVLLIGVMALILFSVSEATRNAWNRLNLILLFSLSILTILINGIALSAIAFRLFEFGLTPNRLAVLGANLLILVNLLLVSHSLLMNLRGKMGVEQVENRMALFLPVYAAWTALVTLTFPLLFQFS